MLYLATDNGVFSAERTNDWRVTGSGLVDQQVTSIIAQPGLILAGTWNGIYTSEDGGRTWLAAGAGPDHPHIRWLAWRNEDRSGALAGTEPAGIFYTNDRGYIWQSCPEVAALRDRFGWSLPYSPEAGCVRGFGLHGARAYAAVEVGGVLASNDYGHTWQLAGGSDGHPGFRRPSEPFIHPDVHSILVHPASPDWIYAPTGGGFYRSKDGGATWTFLYECYCRAAWVDPVDPEHIILGPASGVDQGGRIEETRDGGVNWQIASANLAVPWAENMVERFVQVGEQLLAILSDGSLLAASLSPLEWRPILTEISAINAVAIS